MSELIIQAGKLEKAYRMGPTRLRVLKRASLEVRRGEFLAIVGASGSGKSTLLHLLGLLDRPDAGTLVVDDVNVMGLSARRQVRMRQRDIGFVFQFYHLLGELNVLENVQIAQMTGLGTFRWLGRRAAKRREAVELLERLGLGDRLRHHPSELSGGERQRVAIARALVNHPKVLLADEPTGNLDSSTGRGIMEVLRHFNQDRGQTLVMVTHDQSLAAQADRTLHLRDGRLG